jgi:hypothetical protein
MIKKLLILIVAVFILRIVPGCFDCPDDPVFFEFSDLTLSNLDNSGTWSQVSTSDSMFSEAVSFRIQINGYFGPERMQSSFLRNTGFSLCYAFSKCPEILKPAHPITEMSVKTLYPIDIATPVNSEVSNLFVASQSSYESLYQTLDSYIKSLSNKTYDDFAETFNIYLKSKVMNDKARFVITVRLDDNSTISDTTQTIIIRNEK